MCGNHRIQQYDLHSSVQPRNRHRHCKLWQVHVSGKKIINHHYEFSLFFAMLCQNVCTSTSKARTLPSALLKPQFCLTFKAISKVGETLYISDAKGSCVKGQTSTVKTSTGSGTLVLSTYSKSHELKKNTDSKFLNLNKSVFSKIYNFFIFFFRSMLWVPVFMSVKVQQYFKNCKITSKPSIVAFFLFCKVATKSTCLFFCLSFN